MVSLRSNSPFYVSLCNLQVNCSSSCSHVHTCVFRYSCFSLHITNLSLVAELLSASSGLLWSLFHLPVVVYRQKICEVRERSCEIRDAVQLHIAVRVWLGKIFEGENGFLYTYGCMSARARGGRAFCVRFVSWSSPVSHMCTHASLHWQMSLHIGIRILSGELVSPHSGL